MIGKNIILAGDGHFHLYPCFEIASAFSELIRNLDSLIEYAHGNCNVVQQVGREPPAPPNHGRNGGARTHAPCLLETEKAAPFSVSDLTDISVADQEWEIFRLAFLAESGKYDFFHQIAGKQFDGFQMAEGPEANCLSVNKDGKTQLCLAAGRQIVTREKLEILGLGMESKIPDDLRAEEIIERILAAGGMPVLPFSPGKWLFKRGKIALKLAERYGKSLIIGDSTLRPLGWPKPEIMRLPKGKILPGSDPLPMPGEEKYAACYGFVYEGPFDVSKPLTSIKEIIANHPEGIFSAGQRCSMLNVAGRLMKLRITSAG